MLIRSPIAPELLDIIVSELDVDSLKACALAGSSLRGRSQRILLRSLTLGGAGKDLNYGAAYTLLSESPHVATYITRLRLFLFRSADASAEIGTLRQTLAKLRKVRRCVVDGVYEPHSMKLVLEAVLDFIPNPALRQLHIHSTKIPASLMVRLFAAFPVVSFSFMVVDGTNEPSTSDSPSILEHLLLDAECESLYDLLARPQFALHMANLHHLSIDVSFPQANTVIQRAASTLQTLRVSCNYWPERWSSHPLPPLPVLRSVELSLMPHTTLWFTATTAHLLAESGLSELIVTCFLNSSRALEPVLLAALDNAAAVGSARLQIRWRLDFPDAIGALTFSDSAAMIERGMPRTHASGRLAIDMHDRCVDGLPYFR